MVFRRMNLARPPSVGHSWTDHTPLYPRIVYTMSPNFTMTPEEMDRLARKRANAKLGWYLHAAVYLAVNLFLFAMSENGLGQRAWSFKPLLGWGLGLALHGASVWLLGAGGELRERMVQKERQRLQQQQDRRNGS